MEYGRSDDVSESGPELLRLPRELFDKIFSYLTYDDISSVRPVCRAFDAVCRERLNDGLSKVDRLHSLIHREVKGKLPRRESERRNHVLARHIDILSAIETRLSLLNMTYSKYIDSGMCCFIPGKVLDEMFHVLHGIRTAPNPPRAHELLQEMRDISSMAMEHFEEKIVPLLKPEESRECSSRFGRSGTLKSYPDTSKVQKRKFYQMFAHINSSVVGLKKKLVAQRKLANAQASRLVKLEKLLAEQVTISVEYERQRTEPNRRIAELEQKIVDYDQKFVDVMVEIARVRTAGGVAGDASISQALKDGKAETKPSVGGGQPTLFDAMEGKAGKASVAGIVCEIAARDGGSLSGGSRRVTRRLKRKSKLDAEEFEMRDDRVNVAEVGGGAEPAARPAASSQSTKAVSLPVLCATARVRGRASKRTAEDREGASAGALRTKRACRSAKQVAS